MKFGSWNEDIHSDYEQIKRIAFSQRIKPENVDLDEESKTAVVTGRDGMYNVTLDSEHYKQLYLNGAISIEKFNKIVNALLSK